VPLRTEDEPPEMSRRRAPCGGIVRIGSEALPAYVVVALLPGNRVHPAPSDGCMIPGAMRWSLGS
jgi:hypothetical protein